MNHLIIIATNKVYLIPDWLATWTKFNPIYTGGATRVVTMSPRLHKDGLRHILYLEFIHQSKIISNKEYFHKTQFRIALAFSYPMIPITDWLINIKQSCCLLKTMSHTHICRESVHDYL